MDRKTKKTVLNLIKSVDIQNQYSSEQEDRRKWFAFGAYDALRNLSERVENLPEPRKIKVVERVNND